MEVKDIVKKPYEMAEDTINLLKPVRTRTINRYKELQQLGRAQHTSVSKGPRRIHITTPPKIHLSKLEMDVQGNKGTITYDVYRAVTQKDIESDEKDEKNFKEDTNNKGKKFTKRNRVIGNRYVNDRDEPVVEKFIIETIERGKPIKKEEIKDGE